MSIEPDRYRCPECGSSDVVRVAIAYERDRRRASTQSVGIGAASGGLAIGAAASESTSHSIFSERLEPPKYQEQMPSTGLCILVLSLLAFTLAFPPLAIVTIPAGFFGLRRPFRAFYAQQAQAKKDHSAALEDWERRWVCQRCGSVALDDHFKPATGESSSPDHGQSSAHGVART
jgi:ribosomal protein S27AE